MKMNTMENIRLLEFIIAKLLNILCDENIDSKIIDEFLNVLENMGINNIELSTLSDIAYYVYICDITTSFYTQTKSIEYKTMNKNYKQILKNISSFITNLKLYNPIEIFSLYVYMYNNGYLSNNKKWEYDYVLKDFPKISGIDVIMGGGICRSISAMLTDIYKNMGYNSHILNVNTSNSCIENLQNLYEIDKNNKEVNNNNSNKVIAILELLLKEITPLSNHLITMVEKDNINYILDPTNDGFLQKGKRKKLLIPNSNEYMKIKMFSDIIVKMVGISQDKLNIIKFNKQLSLPTITDSEYRKIYLETLNFCKNNIDIFENFYKENSELYKEIYTIGIEQRGMVGRIFPILPNPSKIKKYFNRV